ncbi:hypothetical protein LJ707_02210 [Mucilaginibacter sp. UR6-1]|uniref:hypothetical protein n=1 Tax=Mucilaginibacter sp. UR6-1 TaxID=1435643 RepID=UPI001E39286D|nr:hypothetical protein [Mucilaginibacter sp. UR6-1]MCC8407725.1 hypothetical protein [Mucilaginibacter sp. UR6-1]
MKYFYHHGKLSLSLLLGITCLLICLTSHYILTPEFYENSGNPLSGVPGSGAGIYDALQQWVYVSAIAYLLIKLALVTLILHTACYLSDIKVSAGKIFRIAVLADFIFLIPAVIKLLSFKDMFENGTLSDWHRYYMGSALSFFSNIPADWYYALQSLNLFEVGYWFILAYGLSEVTDAGFDKSLRIVLVSYVPALAVWIAAVTFFSLLMFPATG